jgi:acetyl-CoA synthetase
MPVVLVDPLTGELAADEGEICLDLEARPLGLMTGYQGDEARNSAAMSGGFYHTGDIAAAATRTATSPISGAPTTSSRRVTTRSVPFELESVLIEHPAVAEAAVVPAPDPVRLAVPKAYVVLVAGQEPTRETALSIFAHCRAHLAPFQRIRRLEFSDLPKTVSGKIRRVELRHREEAGGEFAEWRDEMFPELKGDSAPRA